MLNLYNEGSDMEKTLMRRIVPIVIIRYINDIFKTFVCLGNWVMMKLFH